MSPTPRFKETTALVSPGSAERRDSVDYTPYQSQSKV